MKKYTIYLIAASMLFLCSFDTPSKTIHHFNIHAGGIKIGTLTATKEVKDGYSIYNLRSDVSIKISLTRVKDEVTSIYKDNMLQSATIKTSVGRKNYNSSIAWNKDHYDIDINAYHYTRKSIETSPVQYSVARIYFEEPPASAKILSEDYGVFSDVEVKDAHQYQLLYLSKKSRFTYLNGQLAKADMQNSIKNFVISRKE